MSAVALNRRRVYYANNRGNDIPKRYHFNCYGAALFVLGQADRLIWTEQGRMCEWLEGNTRSIYRPRKPGDILVVHRFGLEHAGVYLGNGRYFHKRGSNTAEITTLKGVRETYGGRYSFRRMKEARA